MADKPKPDLTLDWLICHLRWAWLIVAFLIIFLKPSSTQQGDLMIYLLPAAGVVYNLMVLGMLFVGWYPAGVAAFFHLLDVALAIALMWMTGGYTSPMLPVLLFPVIVAVFRFNTETGLLMSALPMGAAYAVSFIDFTLKTADIQREPVTKTIADLTVLFGAGLLAGYISQKQLQRQTQKEKAEINRLRIESKQAKAIYEMANTLSKTLNYQKVLRAMVELAQRALSQAGGETQDQNTVGMVLLFEEEAPLGKLELVAGRNIPRPDVGTKVTPSEGLLARAIYSAEAIVGRHVSRDPVLKNFIALHNCDSVVCAPLRAGYDTYGLVLFANPQPNLYTQEHATLLTIFCNQAIIAMQNAQLYEDLEREQKKLLEKEAQARHELARNLHDGPTQAIATVAMRLNFIKELLRREGNIPKALDELAKVEQITQRTTKEIRTLLFTLRPVVLETEGLAAAIEQYADRLRDLHNLNIELDLRGYNGELDTDAEGVLFAIIEEAIGNAKKHASADLIKIRVATHRVSEKSNIVSAEVIDNGKGFDVKAVQASYGQRGSLGLLNMDERAQMIGGRCFIDSVKGKGTRVKVEVPVQDLA